MNPALWSPMVQKLAGAALGILLYLAILVGYYFWLRGRKKRGLYP